MNNLVDNLVNQIYDYSMGDDLCWKSKINAINYSINDDNSVSACLFSNSYVRHTGLTLTIISLNNI